MDFIQGSVYYILRTSPTYASYLSSLPAYLSSALNQASAYKPPTDLPSLALILIIFVLAYILLTWVWAMIRFWVRLVSNIVFWGAIVGVGAYVWVRGIDGVVQDVQEWSEVWKAEYGRARVEWEKVKVEGYAQPRQGRRGW